MKREFRLSGVAAFLRVDRVEFLSSDEDVVELTLEPLNTEREGVEGEETFETAFLIPMLLLLLLSTEEVPTPFREATDEDCLTYDFFIESPLMPSDPGDVFGIRPVALNTGTDFLDSEIFARRAVGFATFATAGGCEALISGKDRRTGAAAEAVEADPLVAVEPAPFCRLVAVDEEAGPFSGKPPVLFLLGTEETELELDAAALELESAMLFGSNLFRVEPPPGTESFDIAAELGFVVFDAFFAVSEKRTSDWRSETEDVWACS